MLLEVDLAATLFIEDSRCAAAIVEAAVERAAAEGDATAEAFGCAMVGYHRFNLNECREDDFFEALPPSSCCDQVRLMVTVWFGTVVVIRVQ